MNKIMGFFAISLICFSSNFAQTPLFEMKARVKDRENTPLAGMSLFFEGENFKQRAVSNENGQFSIKLPAGKFMLKGNEAVSKEFLTFLEIFADKPNPTDFDLMVETSQICCSPTSDGKPTEIIKFVFPPYPPAARAVRASGEVIVAVKINKEGIVTNAKAEVAHPLLRAASEAAAKNFLFTEDEKSRERDGKIVFAFSMDFKVETQNRFRKPNRLEIFSGVPSINYSINY